LKIARDVGFDFFDKVASAVGLQADAPTSHKDVSAVFLADFVPFIALLRVSGGGSVHTTGHFAQ
jgi:hypothetical protein